MRRIGLQQRLPVGKNPPPVSFAVLQGFGLSAGMEGGGGERGVVGIYKSPTRNDRANQIRGWFVNRAVKPLRCLSSDTFSMH